MSKIDKKIKKLIKLSVLRNHRCLFLILGTFGSQQVQEIYQIISKANKTDIRTLWCSELGPLKTGTENSTLRDSAIDELNVKPQYCSYSDIDQVSRQSFHLIVLQDFKWSNVLFLNSILPMVLGGGALILLLPNLETLEDLKAYNLSEENHHLSRFNKRYLQLLQSCSSCMILDDNLTVLSSAPKSSDISNDVIRSPTVDEKVEELLSKCENDNILTSLLGLCLTGDQAELIFKYFDVLKKRMFHAVVSASSATGRGKSAALGLAIAGSLALNYSNIFISSSCHSNVNVLFQFLLKGLDALHYKEDKDYDLIESVNPKFNGALIGLNVFKDHPQSVRFIFPDDVGHKLEQAELVVIDEAASIPFHKLKQLVGPYIVFMSSSTCGPGSTSPYLYDSMTNNLQQTSQQLKETNFATSSTSPSIGASFQKVTLKEPVHYAHDDVIESWSNQVFCLESAMSSQLTFGCPETGQCQLFCVNRDFLFNGSSLAEKFLQSLLSIFNQSSYVIKPEDFVKFADSPDYKIFVLLPPLCNTSRKTIPEVLCVILIHLECDIPSDVVLCGSNSIEPIPKCFNEWKSKTSIPLMKGIHILNLATHPSYKRMGYGLKALQLLQEMYEGKLISLEEDSKQPSETVPKSEAPLLIRISDVKLESVQYMCVSFNLTADVFSFWKKAGFVPLFLKAENNSESNTCFMFKSIAEEFNGYLQKNWLSFQNYYFTLLNSHCKNFPASFALSFLNSYQNYSDVKELTKEEIDLYLKPYHMKSLEKSQHVLDFHSIIHVILILSKLYFKNHFKDLHVPFVQEEILLSFGLQNKTVDQISKDLGMPSTQVNGLLTRTIRKLYNYLTNIIEKTVEMTIVTSEVNMKPISQDLDEELEEAAIQIKKQQEEKLLDLDVAQYAIKGSEDEWQKALFSGRKTLVSIKSIKKKLDIESPAKNENKQKFKKHTKKKKK